MKKFRKLILGAVTAAAAAVMSLCAVPDGVLPGFSVVASAGDPISLTQNTLPNLLRFETAAIYRLDEDIEITDNTLQIIDDVTFILNGHNITINQTNGQDAVQVYDNKSFVIQGTGNFTANALNTTYGNGIRCYDGASLTIENGPTVTFTSAAGGWYKGIAASNGTGQTLTIDNATVTNTTLDGSGFSNATITNSTISGSTVTGGTIKSSTVTNSTVGGKEIAQANYNENGSIVYTVTFNLNGASGSIDSQNIANGEKATAPTAPTREGYTFKGWYNNEACTGDPFDFENTTITGDTTLYAKWLKHITYIGADGTEVIIGDDDNEDYTLVTSSDVPVTWEAGTYVVADNVEIKVNDYKIPIQANGNINLILCDGKTLTVTAPRDRIVGSGINIFGQSGQTGKLIVSAAGGACFSLNGSLKIYGGDIEATTSGSYGMAASGVTIVRGKVNATGKRAIQASSGKIIISGGNVTAVGDISDNAFFGSLYGCYGVELDWTKPTDSISLTGKIDVYNDSKVTIANGKYFTDGNGGLYSGEQELTVDSNYYAAAALESKTLYPACKFTIKGNAPVGVRLNDDGTVTPPTTTISGLTFDGWYTNESLTSEKYNFEVPVTTNTEFYGKYSVSYIGEDGQETSTDTFTPVTSSAVPVTWTPGTYVVADDVTINGGVVLPASSEVNLILCDGKKLTVTNTSGNAIGHPNGSPINAAVNIFGQSGQTGKLTADGYYSAISVAGAMNIYGGDIEATSSNVQGIYASKSVTIVRGKVKATGVADSAIEANEKIIINGGNVTAVGSTTNFALFGHQGVELGWTKPTDSISLTGNVYVNYSSYNITIADGKYFTDGNGGLYSGVQELTDNEFAAAALENKTLVPAYKMTFTAEGVDDFYGGAPRTTGKVTKPEPVTINGQVVVWYSDNDCTEKFDFANTVITEDTTIYGKAEELTKIPAKAETCTAAGNKEYYKDSDGNLYVKDGEVYKETTLSAVTTAALGHSYKDGKCTRCDAADPDYKEPEPDNGGNNGNGGSSGNSGNSGGYTPYIPSYPSGGSTTTTTTNTNEPKIEGGSGASGWSNITSEIGKTHAGGTITVDMNGTTTVPANVLNAVKGKDIDLVLDMGGGVTWTINGKDITSVSGSIDLGVKLGTSGIPIDVVNNVTNEKYSTTLHLNHSGKFGFKAVMTVPLRKQDAGLIANLFYYNPSKKALEFVSSAKIDKNGNAKLDFNHASDYAIIIDDHPLGGRDVTAKTTGNKVKLTWDAAPGAESYTVYIKKNDKYKEFKTTSKAALTVSGLKNGKTYEFLIRYSVDGKLSELADSYKVSVTAKYKPIVSLTADEGSITIKWSKVENAEKYKVFKYVNGKLKLVTETDKFALRVNGTKAGKEYSYAVKALVDGKWTKVYKSDIATVKAK